MHIFPFPRSTFSCCCCWLQMVAAGGVKSNVMRINVLLFNWPAFIYITWQQRSVRPASKWDTQRRRPTEGENEREEWMSLCDWNVNAKHIPIDFYSCIDYNECRFHFCTFVNCICRSFVRWWQNRIRVCLIFRTCVVCVCVCRATSDAFYRNRQKKGHKNHLQGIRIR